MRESGEMYLESILLVQKEKGSVHAVDVANRLGYSKPSVSRAIGILAEGNYVTVDCDGVISLTESGKLYAEKVYDRHRIITEFLIETTGIDRKAAEADACRIEHILSEETYEKIRERMCEQTEKTEDIFEKR